MGHIGFEERTEETTPASGEQRNPDYPMTVRDAALYLGVSPQTVYLWSESGIRMDVRLENALESIQHFLSGRSAAW